MEDQIKKFLSISAGYGDGYGYGYGYGEEDGSGYGAGYNAGSGYGTDYGSGAGSGDGAGDGYGYDDTSDDTSGDGYDLKMINGDKVYIIDNTPTIIKQVRGNIAKGFIIEPDLTLVPTVVAKQDNKFAHGKTLRDAFDSLHEKLFDDSTEEERLEAFRQHFPDFYAMYPAKELFHWHHVLTGSCRQGRELFCVSHDINIETDMFNIYQFINLTRNSYGGETIRKLVQKQEEP